MNDKNYPWNEIEDIYREFWDADTNCNDFKKISMSLKDRLKCPGSVRIEELIGDIALGLSQIMDKMEQYSKWKNEQ